MIGGGEALRRPRAARQRMCPPKTQTNASSKRSSLTRRASGFAKGVIATFTELRRAAARSPGTQRSRKVARGARVENSRCNWSGASTVAARSDSVRFNAPS